LALKIHPTIQDELLIIDFKEWVKLKHDSQKEYFGKEVEIALIRHLATNGYKDYIEKLQKIYQEFEKESPNNTSTYTHKLREEDKFLIKKLYNKIDVRDKIDFDVLSKWLKERGLIDKRSHHNRIDFLVSIGILYQRDKEPNKYYLNPLTNIELFNQIYGEK
jgi:hypothetical protein